MDQTVIECSDPKNIVKIANGIMLKLSQSVKRPFNMIKLRILAEFGVDGLYERFNGKSVASILAEFESLADVQPVESGEKDDVHYALYDPPRPKAERDDKRLP
jgi:hypothetical protein